MKKIISFIKVNLKYIIILFALLATIYLDFIIFLINKIFHQSISEVAIVSDRILFITFIALLWYTWETKRIREVSQEPVLLLYIRNIRDYKEEKQKQQKEYVINSRVGDESVKLSIHPRDYHLLKIRNVGSGAAFNVEVENKNFEVEKYQAQFFAPNSDEQPIKLTSKNKKPWSSEGLNGETFKITCESINKKIYKFKYEIVDIEKQQIKFIK